MYLPPECTGPTKQCGCTDFCGSPQDRCTLCSAVQWTLPYNLLYDLVITANGPSFTSFVSKAATEAVALSSSSLCLSATVCTVALHRQSYSLAHQRPYYSLLPVKALCIRMYPAYCLLEFAIIIWWHMSIDGHQLSLSFFAGSLWQRGSLALSSCLSCMIIIVCSRSRTTLGALGVCVCAVWNMTNFSLHCQL